MSVMWIDNGEPERVEVRGTWPFRYRVTYPAVTPYKWLGIRESDGRAIHEIASLPLGVWVSRKNGFQTCVVFADADAAKKFCEATP